MKKKKSKPFKFQVSFEDRTPTPDEFIDKFMVLAKLACDTGIERRLKSKTYKNEEEKITERIEEEKASRKFLSGLEKKLKADKELKKQIEESTNSKKSKKGKVWDFETE